MSDKQQDSAENVAQPVEIEESKLDTVAGGRARRGGTDDDDLEDLEIQRGR